MSHYDDLIEAEYLKTKEQKKNYLIGMIKSGKYDEYLNFCDSNDFNTVQVPISDFRLMISIIKSRC